MTFVYGAVLLWTVPSIAGKVTYLYDDLGRLEQVTYQNGPIITYSYDELGNMLGKQFTGMVLHVNTDGSGIGSISVVPTGYPCGEGCYYYDVSTDVTLTAVTDNDNELASWSEAGCPDISEPCVVNVDSLKVVTASFQSSWVTLDIAKSGLGTGIVSSTPAGINCGADCSESLYRGTAVTLTATAGDNSELTGWAGEGCSGTGVCQFIIQNDATVTANFGDATPAAPSALTATVVSNTSVVLNWQDNSEHYETGFKIERKTGEAGPYTQIDTVSADITSYTDSTALVWGSRYYYRVRAYNSFVDSGYSNEVSVKMASFTVNASAGNHGFITPSNDVPVYYGSSQAFNAVADANYCVYRLITDEGTFTTLDYTFNNVTSDHSIHAEFKDCSGKAEVMGNFSTPTGLWARYNDGSWIKINSSNPLVMTTGDIDGSGQKDLLVRFDDFAGLWVYYDNATWVLLSNDNPVRMITGDLDGNGVDEIIADFETPAGLWAFYNNTSWIRLADSEVDNMAAGEIDGVGTIDLVADTVSDGFWIYYNNESWIKKDNRKVDHLALGDLDGNGIDDIIVQETGVNGLWANYNNSSNWGNVASLNPLHLTTGDLDNNGYDEILVDTGSDLWKYSNNNWERMAYTTLESMMVDDVDGNGIDDLIVDNGSSGMWIYYNNTTWTRVPNAPDPINMATGNLDGN